MNRFLLLALTAGLLSPIAAIAEEKTIPNPIDDITRRQNALKAAQVAYSIFQMCQAYDMEFISFKNVSYMNQMQIKALKKYEFDEWTEKNFKEQLNIVTKKFPDCPVMEKE